MDAIVTNGLITAGAGILVALVGYAYNRQKLVQELRAAKEKQAADAVSTQKQIEDRLWVRVQEANDRLWRENELLRQELASVRIKIDNLQTTIDAQAAENAALRAAVLTLWDGVKRLMAQLRKKNIEPEWAPPADLGNEIRGHSADDD